MPAHKKAAEIRKFLSYYAPYKFLLTADLACALIVAALALLLPMCVRYITGTVIVSGSDAITGELTRMGAVMIAIIAAQTGFSIFYDYKGHDMGAKIERDMRLELYSHYQALPFSFYDDNPVGSLMSRLVSDLYNMAEMCHHSPENLMIYGTQFIGSVVFLSIVNWRLTAVICVILAAMAAYSIPFYKRELAANKESRERISDVNALIEESLSGIRVIKGFAAEGEAVSKFARANERFYKSRSNLYKNESLNYQVAETFFKPLITVAIIIFGGAQVARGELMPADLLIFIMYAAYLTDPVPRLAFMVQQIQEGMTGFARFREIMKLMPDIRDAENAAQLRVTRGAISFKDVTFRYREGHEYVLKDVNLDIKPGETVAIVGRSGIGKTTLCSLIPRFYDATAGEILIDGADVRGVTLDSLRRQIGIVRQETFLFAGTVMDNILFGNPGAASSGAIEAAKLANAHEFIMELPNGYDTEIGQRGVKLSGGQQQRISIARVFLKDPPILIFDEATSALDYESERAVMDSLTALAKGRTAIIIAHRLSTIKNAGRIIVLADEGIAEEGTHDELRGLGGEYVKLYGSK